LARLELRIAFETLLSRLPNLRVDTSKRATRNPALIVSGFNYLAGGLGRRLTLSDGDARVQIREVTLADEVPAPLGDVPDASENYAVWAYDFDADVGFFAHLGRWSLDRSRWREQLYVFLPDHRLLVHRGVGSGDSTRGPWAAHQRQLCIEPGRRWKLGVLGPGRAVPQP